MYYIVLPVGASLQLVGKFSRYDIARAYALPMVGKGVLILKEACTCDLGEEPCEDHVQL